MARSDQDQIKRALQSARERDPLPRYTEEEERSVVEHAEAIKRYKDKGGSHANLVTDTLANTLDVLPRQHRLWFALAVCGLVALAMGAYVFLKVRGVW